jgi:DNA-binding CsgD family transcriptional regulator
MRGDCKTGRRKVTAAERRGKAFELRKAGLSYQKIGDQLGITRQAAHSLVTNALRQLNEKTAEDAAELTRLELERLDDCQAVVVHEMRTGNRLAAVDRLLRIQERRSKLLGLDAPERLAVREQGVYQHEHKLAKWYGRPIEELTDAEITALALGQDPDEAFQESNASQARSRALTTGHR